MCDAAAGDGSCDANSNVGGQNFQLAELDESARVARRMLRAIVQANVT
jgi:hypothetical protein